MRESVTEILGGGCRSWKGVTGLSWSFFLLLEPAAAFEVDVLLAAAAAAAVDLLASALPTLLALAGAALDAFN